MFDCLRIYSLRLCSVISKSTETSGNPLFLHCFLMIYYVYNYFLTEKISSLHDCAVQFNIADIVICKLNRTTGLEKVCWTWQQFQFTVRWLLLHNRKRSGLFFWWDSKINHFIKFYLNFLLFKIILYWYTVIHFYF